MSSPERLAVRAVVTDIEGTTTDIAFVHRVLFPYSRAHLGAFVAAHHDAPAIAALLHEAATLAALPPPTDDAARAALVARLIDWIDEDRKFTPLKGLQGHIWRQGYERGDFTGHVYPDAVAALRAWHGAGIALFVYSSGSVAAQQLLFGYSDAGDLTPLFRGYFDTTTGPKQAVASYEQIAAAVGESPSACLFLSDVTAELDAARAAGMHTRWLVREGGLAVADGAHEAVASFADIVLAAG